MWAGSRFAFAGEPLRIGDAARRVSTVKSIEPKTGSSGSMVFVTVEHTLSGPRGVALVEEHDIVYREAAKPGETAREPKPAPTDATAAKTIVPDPVLLFRFSALTFNGHRIHYDQPYVTGTEGYPGLIVHGPLLGLLQIELARRSTSGKTAATFEFRALSPIYAGAPFHGRRAARGRRLRHHLGRQCQGRPGPARKGDLPVIGEMNKRYTDLLVGLGIMGLNGAVEVVG
jgi:3-methylfumaryl-CoA hydratase